MSELLKKITDLDAGTPLDTDVIPYVDLVSGSTKKALKSELKGDKGDTGTAATVDAGTTTTLAAGQSATVTNVGTTSAAIFNFAIPQGIQGVTGANGACVESVAFVGNDMVFTLDDASTVTLTNAKVTLKGDTGDTGAKITSAEFISDDLVFTLDDASTVTITGAKTALKGDKGDTGLTGIDWQGAWSAGTYTVTQAVSHNGSSWIATTTTTEEPSISATDWDLIALKGTDGAGSGDMMASVYDPTSVEGDAFDMDNMAQGTTNKFISDAQLTVLSNTSGTNTGDEVVATGAEVDTGTDNDKMVTPKAIEDSSYAKNPMTTAGDTIYGGASGVPTRLGVGTAGQVLTVNSEATAPEWADASGGGTSLWTAITGTRASNTTITVATDLTAIFKKGMIVRWQESGVDKVGMVSIPSTYSSPNTTITIIGDTCASIDEGTFKYSVILGAEPYIAKFAYAGTVGAVATNVMNAYYATEPMKVIGADLQVGTAGTTNNTTIDINKGGNTMFTTKPTLATTVASSPTPFTADTTSSLALGDKVTVDVDAVQTTAAIDLYVQLYLFPTRFLTLS